MNYTKKITGLTGYYCSGKSTVEKYLHDLYGYFVIDVDLIGHTALEEKKEELVNQFGSQITKNDRIDRKILGSLVFNDKKKLKTLNGIVHPFMVEEVKRIISGQSDEKILINAALLFEMGLNKLCNNIIIVRSSLLNIISRAKKRDNKSIYSTIRILLTQKVRMFAKKIRGNAEIFYITNNSDLTELEKQIGSIINKL